MQGQNPTGWNKPEPSIEEDSSVQITSGSSGKPEIESVKPIFRPPEKFSEPIKPYWKWIWLTVIVLVVLAWIFLFWYFNHHHAPFSAPLH
ncbi:MAG TPA: hypothetical protein VF261_01055 [Candidatus Saccharimonadales bacterium]